MLKMILLAALAAPVIAASSPSQAQIPAGHQARPDALVRVVYNDNYGHWLKCADAAGMCGVATG